MIRRPPRSTLFSLHDALPIWYSSALRLAACCAYCVWRVGIEVSPRVKHCSTGSEARSEEHTSELQSRLHLVCRLLLEQKKTQPQTHTHTDRSVNPYCENTPVH